MWIELVQAYLRFILNYDSEIGKLVWRDRSDRSPQWNGRYAGMDAGCETYFERGGPYIVLSIDNRTYLAHRIIWFYHYGYMPDHVDHWDGDGINNKSGNLRDASQSLNNANSNLTVRGTEKHGLKYRARIKIEGQTIHLGSYDTEAEAHAIFRSAHDLRYAEYSRYNRPTIARRA